MTISEKEKFNTAFKLHSQGKINEALKLYEEILQYNPDNAEILNLSGIIKLSQNKLNEAENLIKKAVSIKKDAYFYENLARVYEAKADYPKEIKILEEAEKVPNCGFEIYFLLGLAYKNNVEYEKSETAYLKAITLNPKSEKACYNLASLYLFLNKPEKAMMLAVKGMLPHNSLGHKMGLKLHVYAGEDHKHAAQKPEALDITNLI